MPTRTVELAFGWGRVRGVDPTLSPFVAAEYSVHTASMSLLMYVEVCCCVLLLLLNLQGVVLQDAVPH